MSAQPQPLPNVPVSAPAEPRRPNRAWIWALALVALGVGSFAVWKSNASVPAAVRTTPTAKVTRGPLEVSLRVTGQTTASRFRNVTAPRLTGPEANRPLVLTKLIDHGVMVQQGQLLAEIDSAGLKDHMDDVWSSVLQAEADIEKRKAEQAVEWETLQQTLRVAKASLEKASLDLRTAELKTAVDRELMQLAVEEAQARYAELSKDQAVKRRVHEAELATLDFTRRRHVRHFQRHEVDLTRFTMSAPISGRAVLQQIWSGDQPRLIRLGDQVYPSMLLTKVIDPASLVLEGQISQSDSAKLQLGQEAYLTFDAFPSLKLPGAVSAIGAIATRSWRQQFYIRNVRLAVQPKELDPKVITDISGAADVTLARHDNQLLVPLGAVRSESGKHYVQVKKGKSFERRAVQVSASNLMYAALSSGVREGEEVALSEPVPQGEQRASN